MVFAQQNKNRVLFYVLAGFFGFTGWSQADQIFRAKGEAIQTLAVNGSQGQVFSACIPSPVGKTVDVRVQTEVTNDLGFNVGVGHSILVYNYMVKNGRSTLINTYNLNPATMTNVTPDIHHMVIIDSGIENVSANASVNTKCYTLTLWAVSNAGSGNLKVESGYGHLTIAVRPQ